MGTVGARRASGASGAARHVDAVNNGRQDIDQIYTAALTLKFAGGVGGLITRTRNICGGVAYF